MRKYGSLDNMELHHEQAQMAKTKKHIAKRKEESQKVLTPPFGSSIQLGSVT